MSRALINALTEIANGYVGDQTAEDQFVWAQNVARAAIASHETSEQTDRNAGYHTTLLRKQISKKLAALRDLNFQTLLDHLGSAYIDRIACVAAFEAMQYSKYGQADKDVALDELEATLAASDDGWQPIETAPKDGIDIIEILCCYTEHCHLRWAPTYHLCKWSTIVGAWYDVTEKNGPPLNTTYLLWRPYVGNSKHYSELIHSVRFLDPLSSPPSPPKGD